MTSIQQPRILGSVISLLAATLYQGNQNSDYKQLWNIVSTDIHTLNWPSLSIFRVCEGMKEIVIFVILSSMGQMRLIKSPNLELLSYEKCVHLFHGKEIKFEGLFCLEIINIIKPLSIYVSRIGPISSHMTLTIATFPSTTRKIHRAR